jgi:archaellum component FlaC
MLAVFQTGVFRSQIGRLRSVIDPLVIEAIRFYDRLSNLERVMSRLTAISFELPRFTKEEVDRLEAAAEDYRSALDEVIRRVGQLLPDVEKLIRKLPEK